MEFSTIVSIFALLFAVVAVWYALRVAKFVVDNNKASTSLRALTEIQVELTEHADSIKALHGSLSKLRSRIGMRNLREKDAAQDDMPDSKADPAAWKEAMRKKLAANQLK